MLIGRRKNKLFIVAFFILLMMAVFIASPSSLMNFAVAEEISEDDSESSRGFSVIPDWVYDVIQSVKDLVYTLTHINEVLRQWFEGWLISIADSILEPMVNIWGTYMIETPLIGPVGFVNKTWNLSLFIALPLFGLALIPMAWRMWTAQNSLGLKQPVMLFLKAASGCMLTLYIIDFLLVLKNKVSTSLAQLWLKEASERLGQDMITLDMINGIMLLKAGLVSDPANMDASVTLGHVFYNELGLGWVFLAMPLITLITLVMLLTWVLLALLGISAPIYFVIGALLGRMESLAGWVNITVRTIMLPFLFLVTWGICVSVNDPTLSTEVGVSPVLVCLVIMVISLILSWFIWCKPAYRAVAQPVTLNGGEVLERGGQWLAEASSAANAIAKNMGLNRVAETSGEIERFGKKVETFGAESKRYGQRLQPRSSNEVNIIDKDPLPLPTFMWNHSERQSTDASIPAAEGIYLAPTPEAAQTICSVLQGKGIDAKVNGSHINIKINPGQKEMVDKTLSEIYSEKTPYWKAGHEYLTLENGLPVRNPNPPTNGLYMGEYKGK